MLAECSPSNKTSGNKRVNCGRRQKPPTTYHLYPKFHCELDFVEWFWCAAKWYARENCEYSFDGLRQLVPAALVSVTASIN